MAEAREGDPASPISHGTMCDYENNQVHRHVGVRPTDVTE